MISLINHDLITIDFYNTFEESAAINKSMKEYPRIYRVLTSKTNAKFFNCPRMRKALKNDINSGKSNFENHIELQPCQSDQGPQCLV